ncbi:MAG: HEAT repeat domain-containing protein, partial [Planctomycetota bacterium]|jgi:HEAT repeat protein
VPALAKLLTAEKLSHMARFALERNPSREAGDALRSAMGTVSGKLKLGMVATLGGRRDAGSVSALRRMLAAGDEETVRAAISALGRIGTREAAAALAYARVPEKLKRLAADASLMCADRLAAAGEGVRASAIYDKMFAEGNPKMIRIAALRGIVMSQKEGAAGLVVSLMRDKDVDLRRAASKFVVEMPGEAATRALAAELGGLPPEAQVVLIDALTARGDPAAAPSVTGLVESGNEAVRIAAIRALAVMGDASSVPILAKVASTGGEIGKAAVDSLNRIKGEGVGRAMADLLDSPDPAIRAGIINVMTARADRTVAPAMVKAARDRDETIRKAAIKGLAVVAGLKELPDIVDLLIENKDTSIRSELEKALAATAMRISDAEARTEAIVTGLGRADADAKARMLGVLGRLGGRGALAAARAQLKSYDAEVATAAVRALAGWPDATPAPDLLDTIRTTKNSIHRVLAFRGYIRMVNMPSERTAADTGRMYAEALRLAKSPTEKKSVLAGLAGARSEGALRLVEGLLTDDSVKAEAELALVQIASNCRDSAPDEARAALKKIIATTRNGGLRGKAEGVIRDMDKYRGYITSWLGSGPYTKGQPFNTAYPPEKPDAQGVKWKALTKGVAPLNINLLAAIGPGGNRAAYMKTHVYSSTDQDVRLEMGSDDGIKVWINDKLVHSNPAVRGIRPGEDKAKARLRRGWNKVLVKIAQGGGDWAFCLRITKPDGSVLEGLRVNVDGK